MNKYYVKIRNITTGELFCESQLFDTQAEAVEFARNFNRRAIDPEHYSRILYRRDTETCFDEVIGEVPELLH